MGEVSPLGSGRSSSQEKSCLDTPFCLPPTFWRYLYSVLSSSKTRRDDQAAQLFTQYSQRFRKSIPRDSKKVFPVQGFQKSIPNKPKYSPKQLFGKEKENSYAKFS